MLFRTFLIPRPAARPIPLRSRGPGSPGRDPLALRFRGQATKGAGHAAQEGGLTANGANESVINDFKKTLDAEALRVGWL
jgi:hypothetical protein